MMPYIFFSNVPLKDAFSIFMKHVHWKVEGLNQPINNIIYVNKSAE